MYDILWMFTCSKNVLVLVDILKAKRDSVSVYCFQCLIPPPLPITATGHNKFCQPLSVCLHYFSPHWNLVIWVQHFVNILLAELRLQHWEFTFELSYPKHFSLSLGSQGCKSLVYTKSWCKLVRNECYFTICKQWYNSVFCGSEDKSPQVCISSTWGSLEQQRSEWN